MTNQDKLNLEDSPIYQAIQSRIDETLKGFVEERGSLFNDESSRAEIAKRLQNALGEMIPVLPDYGRDDFSMLNCIIKTIATGEPLPPDVEGLSSNIGERDFHLVRNPINKLTTPDDKAEENGHLVLILHFQTVRFACARADKPSVKIAIDGPELLELNEDFTKADQIATQGRASGRVCAFFPTRKQIFASEVVVQMPSGILWTTLESKPECIRVIIEDLEG